MIDRHAALGAALGQALSRPGLGIERIEPVGGGCTSTALRAVAGGRRYFLKLADDRDRLEAEADGLVALARCASLRIPAVLGIGTIDDGPNLLVLEHLPLTATGNARALGRALAELHALTGPGYGWTRNNYIGATPQSNARSASWPDFLVNQRLRPQLALAARNGAGDFATLAAPVLAAIPALFADAPPPPSLLHGDLWHGNVGFVDDRPTLFDPAVHYGDSESDLAMSGLFGGFAASFLAAYREVRPEPPGAALRHGLYRLYHLLNHFNLFGDTYAAPVRREIGQFVAELRGA